MNSRIVGVISKKPENNIGINQEQNSSQENQAAENNNR